MLSEFIHARLSYPAVHLAVEQVHQRSVQLGPLVLESNPLKNRTPAVDRRPTCLTLLFSHCCEEWTISYSLPRMSACSLYGYFSCEKLPSVLSKIFLEFTEISRLYNSYCYEMPP